MNAIRLLANDADLSGRVIGRGKGHDPTQVHGNIKPQHISVKSLAIRELVGLKVGTTRRVDIRIPYDVIDDRYNIIELQDAERQKTR